MNILNKPTWEREKKIRFPQLNTDIDTDIVVIGGGITGILTAHLLSKSNKNVVVLEKNTIVSDTTMYTTAHITHVVDTDIADLISMFGKRKTKLIWQSGSDAIDIIEKIINKEKIDCEFKRISGYKYAQSNDEFKLLEDEHKMAQSLGFKTKLQKNPKLGFRNFGALEIPNQAEFDPIKFCYALSKIVQKNGVKIFEQTGAEKVSGTHTIAIKTNRGKIKANYVVFATYWPFHKHLDLFGKKGEYTSYVFEVKIPKKTIPEGLYWDLENPYHYIRIDAYKTHDRMIIGGEDHRVELPIKPEKNYKALKEYLKHMLPNVNYTITRKWNGPILETIDGIPLIGKLKPRQLIATGFSGNGMTYAAISATMFRDIIMKQKNPYVSLYNPNRIPTPQQLMKKGKDYTTEFIHGAINNQFRFH